MSDNNLGALIAGVIALFLCTLVGGITYYNVQSVKNGYTSTTTTVTTYGCPGK